MRRFSKRADQRYSHPLRTKPMVQLIVDDAFFPEDIIHLVGVGDIIKIEPGIKFTFEPGFLQGQVYIIDGFVYI